MLRSEEKKGGDGEMIKKLAGEGDPRGEGDEMLNDRFVRLSKHGLKSVLLLLEKVVTCCNNTIMTLSKLD